MYVEITFFKFSFFQNSFSEKQWQNLDPIYDITEVLVQVGEFEGAKNLMSWSEDEVPDILKHGDHHHNIAQRLNLLPVTPRGYRIKKMMAYYYLQYFFDYKELNLEPNAGAEKVYELLAEQKPMFMDYKTEYYAMMSVIRLIDVMVGNEPFVDFKRKKYEVYILLQVTV